MHADHETPGRFFLLGMQKSGTTWLQTLLDSHPAIICRNEGGFQQFATALARSIGEYDGFVEARADVFGKGGYPHMTPREVRALYRTFLDGRMLRDLGSRPAVRWVGDKDPNHGQEVRLLLAALPEARFVQIVRDGRDQAVSSWHHVHRIHGERAASRFPEFGSFALRLAGEWAKGIRSIRTELAAVGAPYCEVRYEDLLAEPRRSLRRVLNFFEVAADDDTISACLSAADFERLSGRPRGEEDRTSFFRKGIAGDWRSLMDDRLAVEYVRRTGGLMSELGYA
ncbi:sulfotransferase family protein [Faunimonas sp. B44]|uniref:sulfotransferase family protein n=1 Tax=Faunimonas sp. B44 TaxID=3461493 RepID=UPI004044D144